MTLFSVLPRVLTLAALAMGLSGCFPVGSSPADEEKDPHYLAGKNRLSAMDYDGAIAAFENALISNPKSAAAHLELGFLYEEKKNNYATAIHHFEKHLELRPESNMAETIKQRIFSCKLELAKTVPFALVSRQVQDEIRKLYVTNEGLHSQIEQLKSQLVEQEAAFSNRLAMATQAALAAAAATQRQSATPEPERRSSAPSKASPPSANPSTSSRSAVAARTHTVKAGETLDSISRRYNIRLSALQSANPRVEARKLKAGQVLNIPPPAGH
ncbi:MAG: LysM peptidoglycan-binding domain-containing protein [Verrucomicrobiota bacterium]